MSTSTTSPRPQPERAVARKNIRARKRAAALRCPGDVRRSAKPPVCNQFTNSRDDPPDTRVALSAFGLTDPENANAPIIAAADGYSVLVILSDRTRKVCGYASHPIIAWKMCHGGSSPFPITFSCDVKYCRMCDLAVEAPTGKVMSFEGRMHACAGAWVRERRRVLLREEP